MSFLKKSFLFLVGAMLAASVAWAGSDFSFTANDRVLVIAPHPDDETLGAGGMIQAARKGGAEVKVVYLTHGDHNEMAALFYQKKPLITRADFIRSGQTRMAEAESAMRVLGLQKRDLIFLGYPDFGTLKIWQRHWKRSKPFRSLLTRINRVPYRDDFSYGSAYTGENITKDFETILLSFKPTRVFVTAPFDWNPDHKACYLFLNLAFLNLAGQIPEPIVTCYLIHGRDWPISKRYSPVPYWNDPPRWTALLLSPEELGRKKEAILKYQSQIAYRKKFLLSFAGEREYFTRIPYEAPGGPARQRFSGGPTRRKADCFIENGELRLSLTLDSAFDEIAATNVEIFPYKKSEPFSSMPKLRFKFLGHRTVKLRVPMSVLRDPDHLFIAWHTAKEELAWDKGSWKISRIEETSRDEPHPDSPFDSRSAHQCHIQGAAVGRRGLRDQAHQF
ncbi:MAG: PIG-L family deacetylase [Candidatus Omnitrophica bacterium]|nr:PIG-L family deacetylase [Candidatus Omnitrophota bacterium]